MRELGDSFGFRFQVSNFGLRVSRSRTAMVFSRVEVEIGRGGFI